MLKIFSLVKSKLVLSHCHCDGLSCDHHIFELLRPVQLLPFVLDFAASHTHTHIFYGSYVLKIELGLLCLCS